MKALLLSLLLVAPIVSFADNAQEICAQGVVASPVFRTTLEAALKRCEGVKTEAQAWCAAGAVQSRSYTLPPEMALDRCSEAKSVPQGQCAYQLLLTFAIRPEAALQTCANR